MPLFDFECEKCGTIYEQWLLNSRSVPVCTNCKSIVGQKKVFLEAPFGYATDDNAPKNNQELSNYAGNGQYFDSRGNIKPK